MEDALCLVFLEHEFEAFLEKYPDESKATDILQKTWRKMSDRGHQAALRSDGRCALPRLSRARVRGVLGEVSRREQSHRHPAEDVAQDERPRPPSGAQIGWKMRSASSFSSTSSRRSWRSIPTRAKPSTSCRRRGAR